MVSGNNRGEEVVGTNPAQPTTGTVAGPDAALIMVPEVTDPPEIPLLGDLGDTDDEKARWDTFQLLMQGFYTATRTLSDSYCCDIGQIDIFSRIELFPSNVLSSDNTNCKNDI